MKLLNFSLISSFILQYFSYSYSSCPKNVRSNHICSRFGDCTTLSECDCYPGHFGIDCSFRSCPKGISWSRPSAGTDNLHNLAECSDRGKCNYDNGRCSCDEGFTGSACDRMECPNNCNGNGECVSMKYFAEHNPFGDEVSYITPWDASKIYGCSCHLGYDGADCSIKLCPHGDDPMTTSQVNEVQLLKCIATSGSFELYFNRFKTTIQYDYTAAQLKNALETLNSIREVTVSFSLGETVCNSATNVVQIEFVQDFGPQPPLKVGSKTFASSIDIYTKGSILEGIASVEGTKENESCAGRGECLETGECNCYKVPFPGYQSSNGNGNPGNRGDCGAADDQNYHGGAITGCPGTLPCNGHGACSGSTSFKCSCEAGWKSGDCSIRTCPKGISWFDYPTATNDAHNTYSECSGGGLCSDTSGDCQCFSQFTGPACDFMKCPGIDRTGIPCNGHGACVSNSELALETIENGDSTDYTYGENPNDPNTWDSKKIFGCRCDSGYTGYDCSKKTCPKGDNPSTTDQVDEIQILKCKGTGGTFKLRFQRWTTVPISYSASTNDIRNALISLPTIDDINVEFIGNTVACSDQGSPHTIKLTFVRNPGELPAIRADFSSLTGVDSEINVATGGETLEGTTSVTGTKEFVECSNKGWCDYDNGVCICLPNYGSSDGIGNIGNRGDCGYLKPFEDAE